MKEFKMLKLKNKKSILKSNKTQKISILGASLATLLASGDNSGPDIFIAVAAAENIDGGDDIDTIDYSASTASVSAFLDGTTGSRGFAEGDELVNIENLIGTPFADYLVGNGEANIIQGLAGNDTIVGGDGDDTLIGGSGADVLNGGGGIDTASFRISTASVGANLDVGGSFGDAAGDSYFNIENLEGTAFHDTLSGDDNDNVISGLDGRDALFGYDGDDHLIGGNDSDTLDGGLGADILDGGEGTDRAAYYHSNAGVNVNLSTGIHSGGHAEGDQLISIENIEGSNDFGDTIRANEENNSLVGLGGADYIYGYAGNDIIYGGNGDDFLYGNEGDDTIHGGEGGDVINGDVGIDTALYTSSPVGVTVNLSTNVNMGGHAEGDNLLSIERLVGSSHSDGLTGNEEANRISGYDGDDYLNGLAGNDEIYGQGGNDIILGGEGSDILSGGAGDDYIFGGDDNDSVIGHAGNDHLNGGEGNDVLTMFGELINFDVLKADGEIIINYTNEAAVIENDVITSIETLYVYAADGSLINFDSNNLWDELSADGQAQFANEADFQAWLGLDAGYNYDGI